MNHLETSMNLDEPRKTLSKQLSAIRGSGNALTGVGESESFNYPPIHLPKDTGHV
jgi:hypothetical protein